MAGVLGASLLTTWVTFVPCFLFIFLGAPYVERLRHNPAPDRRPDRHHRRRRRRHRQPRGLLRLHTLFDDTTAVDTGPFHFEVPVWSSWDPLAFTLTGVALVLMFRASWTPLRTLGACAAAGLVVTLVDALLG